MNPVGIRNNKNTMLVLGLSLLATVSTITLTGVSVWFLGAVALASGTPYALVFNFHHPGVLIRFLALARTGAKYGERVLGHAAALKAQIERRDQIFTAIAAAPQTLARSWQLGQEHHLTDFMDDVAHLDFAPLRVDLPLVGILVTTTLVLAASLFISPILALVLALLLAATWLALKQAHQTIARCWSRIHFDTRLLSEDLGHSYSAFVALAGSQHREEQVHTMLMSMSRRRELHLQLARTLAWTDALISNLGYAFAVLTMLGAWLTGARSQALLPAAGVAFFWLALAEVAVAIGPALLGDIQRKTAKRTLDQWRKSDQYPEANSSSFDSVAVPDATRQANRISLQGFGLWSPDKRLLQCVDLDVRSGQILMVTGPSGSGKTTLLKHLAGWLVGSDPVFYNGLKMGAQQLRAQSCLIQHDAAILHGTIRENLFAPEREDADLWRAVSIVEMSECIRAKGGLDALVRGNYSFSQGEAHRFSLARALLSNKPVLLVDEPGEHLDAAQALRIFTAMKTFVNGRILIIASHKYNSGSGTDSVLSLQAFHP